MSSRSLQAAGVISLLMALGHQRMGATELSAANKLGLPARTALKGWFQGCFMYSCWGLNYLRLADTPFALMAPLDKAILGIQSAMHLYTIVGLEQLPPRILSGLLLSLIGSSLLLK